jgi:hypothetical protein
VHTIDWGDFHSAIGGGTNDAPTLWMAGCKNSFPATQLVAFPCPADNGSSYIMDVDFGSGVMHVAKPASDIDDPSSPYYTSNAEDFAAEAFRAFPTSWSAAQAEKTSETDLPLLPETTVRCPVAPGAQAVVRLVYLRLLGRCPEPDGLTYWTAFLGTNGSAARFATAVAASPERIESLIRQSYEAVFDRPVDPGGLKFWVGFFGGGGRFDDFVASLAGSAEISGRSYPNSAARVQSLYSIVLNRPGDPAGVTYWSTRLSAGASPAQLASLLAHSAEFASDVVGATPTTLATFAPGIYQEVLHRQPDANGLSFWSAYFHQHGVTYGIEGLFGGSAELYQQAQTFPDS